jgi:hypothetical protein
VRSSSKGRSDDLVSQEALLKKVTAAYLPSYHH